MRLPVQVDGKGVHTLQFPFFLCVLRALAWTKLDWNSNWYNGCESEMRELQSDPNKTKSANSNQKSESRPLYNIIYTAGGHHFEACIAKIFRAQKVSRKRGYHTYWCKSCSRTPTKPNQPIAIRSQNPDHYIILYILRGAIILKPV